MRRNFLLSLSCMFVMSFTAAVYADEDADIISRAIPSVVLIKGENGKYINGFFVDDDGGILTTYHDLDYAMDTEITLHDNRTLKGSIAYEDRDRDIAFIVLDSPINIPFLKIAGSNAKDNGRRIALGDSALINENGEITGIITSGDIILSPDVLKEFINVPYVLRLSETGTPEQLREALRAGYNFNIQGHLYDNRHEDYYCFDFETPLHRAAYFNSNPESIGFLISQGLDLNEVASCGNTVTETPLSIAIRERNITAFNELLKAGADPNDFADDYNASLFHIVASSYRNYHDAKFVIDSLVKAGGNVNQHYNFTREEERELREYGEPSGFRIEWTPEDPIGEAIFLLSHAGRGNFMSSFTPLMFAVLYDNADVLNILLDHGADPNIRSLEKKTALDYAKFLPKDSKIKTSSAFKRLKNKTKTSGRKTQKKH